MSIADKLVTVAENEQKVYEAGKKAEYDRFWDNYQDHGNRTQYGFAFGGKGWGKSGLLPPKYPIVLSSEAASQYNIFAYFNNGEDRYDMTEVCKMIDCSKAVRLNNMFYNASVENVTVDMSECQYANGFFSCGMGGGNIDKVCLKVTEKMKSATEMFNQCISIVTLRFTEDSTIAIAISFSHSKKLSSESVDSIINALQDKTGQTALKITFHTDVIARMTDEQVNKILAKNWQIG